MTIGRRWGKRCGGSQWGSQASRQRQGARTEVKWIDGKVEAAIRCRKKIDAIRMLQRAPAWTDSSESDEDVDDAAPGQASRVGGVVGGRDYGEAAAMAALGWLLIERERVRGKGRVAARVVWGSEGWPGAGSYPLRGSAVRGAEQCSAGHDASASCLWWEVRTKGWRGWAGPHCYPLRSSPAVGF